MRCSASAPVDSSNVTEADQYSIQGDLPLAILPGVVSSQKNVTAVRPLGSSTRSQTSVE